MDGSPWEVNAAIGVARWRFKPAETPIWVSKAREFERAPQCCA